MQSKERTMTTKRKKLLAVSAVLGMVIGIGITASVGGGVYYAFQEQADLFSTSTQLEIRNVNAIRNGDTLSITANIKNAGSTSVTDIFINEISTGDSFKITDDDREDGRLNVVSGTSTVESFVNGKTNAQCGIPATPAIPTTEATGDDILDTQKGFSICPTDVSSLDGGASVALQLKVSLPNGTGNVPVAAGGVISDNITISDRLTMQLAYTSGDDEYVSDIYNTRVKPG